MRPNTHPPTPLDSENNRDSTAEFPDEPNNALVSVDHILEGPSLPNSTEQVDKAKGRRKDKAIQKSTTTASRTARKVWIKTLDVAKSVARALGLMIFAHFIRSIYRKIRHVTGRGLHEPTKKAIRKDRTIALLRCLIHLFPVSISLFEIVLNWNTYYVGVSIYNQAVYQIVAKIHEIAIQASLATVVFSYIRHEMTIGNGIPFGTLFSGLHISQIAYLWSMEFWGSLRSPHLPPHRKIALSLLVFVSIVLASLSGPSSAILLIPRQDYWPGGNTDIWINATIDDLYPTRIDRTLVPEGCLFAPEDVISNGCPFSEWETIQEYHALTKHILPMDYQLAYRKTTAPLFTEVSGKSSQRQQYTNELLLADFLPLVSYVSSTQQAAVADALTTTSSYWFLALTNVTSKGVHGSPLSDQSNSIHTLTGDNYQPFSMGACLPDSIRSDNDTRPLALPLLPLANDPATANANITSKHGQVAPAIVLNGLSRADIMSEARNTSQYRLQWIDLPQPEFNGSSIGAIVMLPRSESDMAVAQNITLCNFAAGWGTTTLQMQQYNEGASSVSSYVPSEFIIPGSGLGSYFASTPESSSTSAYWENYPQYPQRLTNITQEWAQYLDPIVRSANRTVFDLIMQETDPFEDPRIATSATTSVNSVLVWLMANGLARIGFESTLQGSLKSVRSADGTSWIDGSYWVSNKGNMFEVDPVQSKDWLKFHVNSTLEGYAYNTETVGPRFAIAVMTIYCMIALAHLLYSGISGISSTCWDSIAEVTALAMNSTPTAALRNTCAGITELHIFQLPVRVLAKRDDEEGDGEHLELVFGNHNSVSGGQKKGEEDGNLIVYNRAYGTMPLLRKRGK